MTIPDADHPHHYLISYTYNTARRRSWGHAEVALRHPWAWGDAVRIIEGLHAPGAIEDHPAIVSVLKLSDPPVRVES